jgi:hypothetical protein
MLLNSIPCQQSAGTTQDLWTPVTVKFLPEKALALLWMLVQA